MTLQEQFYSSSGVDQYTKKNIVLLVFPNMMLVLFNTGNYFLLLSVEVMWLYMFVEHYLALFKNNGSIHWSGS